MTTGDSKVTKDMVFSVLNRFAGLLARFLFHREILRNEIRDEKGPFVLLCNHECALDAILLGGLFQKSPVFVMSDQFYYTVPIKGLLKKLNIIHKLQFKTKLSEMKKMKDAAQTEGMVLFPAGLMCADGKSTPIPKATSLFLQFLGVTVYVARISGSYFVQPKWSAARHPGKTTIDVYQLFTAEELKRSPLDEIESKINEALDFDAYREQEELLVRYKNADHLEGMENVVYRCPHCGKAYTIKIRDHHTIFCESCGFTEQADEYGFLHLSGNVGKEIRYISDWSRQIYALLKAEIESDSAYALETHADIQTLNREAGCFESIGQGKVTLNRDGFEIEGLLNGEVKRLKMCIDGMPTLPFKPGKCFDIQTGDDIYRCLPEKGQVSIQFTHMTEIFYELSQIG